MYRGKMIKTFSLSKCPNVQILIIKSWFSAIGRSDVKHKHAVAKSLAFEYCRFTMAHCMRGVK